MIFPGVDWRNARNHSGPMTAHLGVILHVQEGNNDLGPEFDDPASSASYHFVVLKDGTIQQYVDTDMTAWAQAAGNGSYLSIGTQGFSTEPLTESACQSIADLYNEAHLVYNIPFQLAEQPGQPGFGWHGMGGTAWGGHFDCPGDIRKGQRQHILDLAQGDDMAGLTKDEHDALAFIAGVIGHKTEKDDAGADIMIDYITANTLKKVRELQKDMAAIKAHLGIQ